MKTRVDTNSLEAYSDIDLSKRQEEVLAVISNTGTISAKGIAYALKIPINKVTGRVNELMHKQRIKIAKIGKDVQGGKNVNFYSVRGSDDPLNIFEKSWEEKCKELEKWLREYYPTICDEAEEDIEWLE